MQQNLWMYATPHTQNDMAGSLIAFGAETFKGAKVIKDLDSLIELNRQNPPNHDLIKPFAFEYLIDCVRILIFFENYMKAELIARNYCVHKIINLEIFKILYKKQYKEPITLHEIEAIQRFTIDNAQNIFTHSAILETTIGNNILLNTAEYRKHYQFNDSILQYIKKINILRNSLHLQYNVSFELSNEFIENIKRLNDFVDVTVQRLIPH